MIQVKWFSKKDRGPRVDPEELLTLAHQTTSKVETQQPHVNFINSYLDARYRKNGLGEDFEWTLKVKGNEA